MNHVCTYHPLALINRWTHTIQIKMNKEEFHLYQLNRYPYVNGYQYSYVNPYPYGYQHSYANNYHPSTMPTTMSSSSETLCDRLKTTYEENSTKLIGLYYQWNHATSQEAKNAINERINELEAQQSTIQGQLSYLGCP
ncbi:hypothetical protein CN988_24230 [Bacillus thuringiensis]|nr:hypothetical protein COM78_21155 [Bacillus thuringiensis]PEA12933.1 hypothetical protein CON42_24155 [Bacillus thuringiensis]PES41343.1 hypothetical protein CN499_30400 [Bacillus thuringiensis]PEV37052.1 hypothetical protein CN426_28660 [Bacillus thuringiensis]PFC05313.1 hypothetical protein CN302_02595 [Bacillus thuringiensis]